MKRLQSHNVYESLKQVDGQEGFNDLFEEWETDLAVGATIFTESSGRQLRDKALELAIAGGVASLGALAASAKSVISSKIGQGRRPGLPAVRTTHDLEHGTNRKCRGNGSVSVARAVLPPRNGPKEGLADEDPAQTR